MKNYGDLYNLYEFTYPEPELGQKMASMFTECGVRMLA
jgi:hypothetical protein